MPVNAHVQPSAPPEAPESSTEGDAFTVPEEAIDEALETCAGDARATIRALLLGQAVLRRRVDEARRGASWGYPRGRPSRWINRHGEVG
ncbi:hypothetical protein FHS55_002085 [Angulomicrobium tetraedrale]|uniref:Uncharacterized protein n=1 Tax=Ancylobacter tetraedralis TaxID=217068 RepID=A0A839Z9S9_9HYPH|nr:hypothetical protein [Ancylobacter tetraedralis]